MSTRTIIEINHDFLHDIEKHPEAFVRLLRALKGSEINGMLNSARQPNFLGMRVLAQRHHSETLMLKVR